MATPSPQPFHFLTSLNLTLLTNRRARDLAELLEHLRAVPGSVIYYHTHHFLVQHQYLSPEPPNDFAYWVTNVLQEDRLGEQLAAIDLVQFRTIRALRERIIAVIENDLEQRTQLRTAPEGEEFHFPRDKPIITQVSRFDRLKDPVGVIGAFRLVRQYHDCRLVLAGGGATDDPEGTEVINAVHEAANADPDIHILELPPTANIEINAIQRASTVILQKSLKEGFGLTVSEALWKGKPVIAGAVGGIPLQITHRYGGILTHTVEGTAFWIKQLLNSPDYARRLGENGREYVRTNFLLTRHLRDYFLMFLFLEQTNQRVIHVG